MVSLARFGCPDGDAALGPAHLQRVWLGTALWFPIHNQVEAVAYRGNRTGYQFARADWVVMMYDVRPS